MISPEFCITAREGVRKAFAQAQDFKARLQDSAGSARFHEVLDEQVKQLADVLEQNAREVGCGITFTLGASSVRETCDFSECPFYPDGPGSV